VKKLSELIILVVDDEPEIVKLLVSIFEPFNSEIYTAESGYDAITIIKNKQVDLIISDIQMDNGTGYDLAEAAGKLPNNPAIIFISGLPNISENILSEQGAISVLYKPFNPALLLSTIKGIKGNILVVDDNQMNREMLAQQLKRKGYNIKSVGSGHAALDLIENSPDDTFDLILLDLMLPEMSGFDVLKRLRTRFSSINLPIIIETARNNRSDSIQALSMGANDFVTKPLDFTNVIARVQTQLSLKHAELELKETKELALQSAKSKSMFLANMSHEIRTPLNGVIGMTSLLESSELSEEQQKYVSVVKHSSEALLEIINDILDFSKIEAGKMKLENIDFSLVDTVEETIDLFSELAAQKGLELVCNINPSIPLQQVGDPGRIRQVLANLISNALKFTMRGYVSITVDQIDIEGKTMTSFYVEDSGIGIPADTIDLLWDSFVQADRSTTRKFGGTGLGLAICKQLCELMKGQIQCKSVLEHGTLFWFYLPLRTGPESKDDIRQKKISILQQRNVVIISGNNHLIESLETMCQGYNCYTHICKSINEFENSDTIKSLEAKTLIVFDFEGKSQEENENHILSFIGKLSEQFKILIIHYADINIKNLTKNITDTNIVQFTTKPIHRDVFEESMLRWFDPNHVNEYAHETDAISDDNEQTTKGTILLVDDNPTNQLVSSKMIKKIGHDVVTAENGEEALNILENNEFTLIFMDCQMPIMDGFVATNEIRKRGKDIIIVAMTANAMKGDRERCLDSGMDDYVPKPIRMEEINSMIAKWNGKRSKKAISEKSIDQPDNVVHLDFEAIETLKSISIGEMDGFFREQVIDFLNISKLLLTDLKMLTNEPDSFKSKSCELRSAAMAIGASNLVELVDRYEIEEEYLDITEKYFDNLEKELAWLDIELRKIGA